MTGLVIKNGHVIDPASGLDGIHTLYILQGFVAGIDIPPDEFELTSEIDATNLIVCPGLIDIRARLREPGQEYKATLDSELTAAVAGGITTLCIPPDTNPVIDTPAMAQMIQQRAWQIGKSFIHPLGALTQNLDGEMLTNMYGLGEAGCVGVSNALAPVKDTVVMRRAMQYASTFDLPVFLNSQDPWLRGNGVVHEGEISTRLGLPAVPEAAETVGVARDLALIEATRARCHFNGLSTTRAVEMIAQRKQEGLPITADVTAHHLHLTEHDIGFFNTLCHVSPPLRSQRDRDNLRGALKDGVIEVICSDHQPHEPDAKLAPFSDSEPGISGLETLLPLTLKLVSDGVLDMPEAIALITANPARVLGIDSGSLGIGATADICIFDWEEEWLFDPQQMRSRGKNSPFQNWQFRGKVTHTLVGGETVYIHTETA